MKSLLQQAQAFQRKPRATQWYDRSKGQEELLVAYLKQKVTKAQVGKALFGDKGSTGTSYVPTWALQGIFALLEENKLYFNYLNLDQ